MTPEKTRTAYCWACGRSDVQTKTEDGVEKYRAHNRGPSTCVNSGGPVIPPPTVRPSTDPDAVRRRAAALEHAREHAREEASAGRAADELHALLDDVEDGDG